MSLFADGAGAAIIAPEGEWRFRETGSCIVPESKKLLGLLPDYPAPDNSVTTYKMALSPAVPNAIYDYFSNGNGRRIMDRFEKATTQEAGGTGRQSRPAMAVHSGGPRILGAVHRAIQERNWLKDALGCSEHIFSKRGNLGSTATLVVLHDMLHDDRVLADHDDIGILAFGPGVAVEYGLLRRVQK